MVDGPWTGRGPSPPQWWPERGEKGCEWRKGNRGAGSWRIFFLGVVFYVNVELTSSLEEWIGVETVLVENGVETWPLKKLLSLLELKAESVGSTTHVPFSCRIFFQYATHPKVGLAMVNSCRGGCQREQYCSVRSQRWGILEGNRSKVQAMGEKVKKKVTQLKLRQCEVKMLPGHPHGHLSFPIWHQDLGKLSEQAAEVLKECGIAQKERWQQGEVRGEKESCYESRPIIPLSETSCCSSQGSWRTSLSSCLSVCLSVSLPCSLSLSQIYTHALLQPGCVLSFLF